jgi:hypothetical protein
MVAETTEETVMGSEADRNVNSWRKPERLYLKCLLVALHDEGLRGNALYEAFAELVPHWRKFFDKPVSDAAPVQRADKARRGGKYAGEAPEAHPVMSLMFPHAVRAAKKRRKYANAELRELAAKIADKKQEKMAACWVAPRRRLLEAPRRRLPFTSPIGRGRRQRVARKRAR